MQAAAISAVGGMVTGALDSRAQKHQLEKQAAEAKTARLTSYREAMANNLAQVGGSGFTAEGSFKDIARANTSTLDNDVSKIDSQLRLQKDMLNLSMFTSAFSSGTDLLSGAQEEQNYKSQFTEIGGKK